MFSTVTVVTRTRLIVTLYVHCLCCLYFASRIPLCCCKLIKLHSTSEGRDSSVGIATRYGLDGRGIESRWGLDFPHQSRPVQGPISLQTMGAGSSPGLMRPGRCVDYPPLSSTEVKERVKLYLCSHSGPSCRVIRWTFYSLLPTTIALIRTILTLRYLVYSQQYDTGNSVHTVTDTLKKNQLYNVNTQRTQNCQRPAHRNQ
jgi:hypothetical protein